ncbi:MAG: SDR family oxidoreductase [Burkholderiaceae bacterium]|nr:SDR family oxidoreductase [Burkholderiaceae bacterium]
MPYSLSGKHILITGAAGGIGSASARVCAELGAHLILADKTEPLDIFNELMSQGRPVTMLAFDVADRAQVEAAIDSIPRLDGVIANAGYCPWDDWNDANWDEVLKLVMDVNLIGVIHLMRPVLKKMSAQKSGHVVLVSSVAARMGGLMASPHYVAAKGGVSALVKWLARKAAPEGVLVNCVAPGATDTPMTQSQTVDVSSIPLRRQAHAQEIALPIAFLCSDAASYICGATLDVNGGVYMN